MSPLFQGEVQFRRYSDTSTQGQQIVFSVPDREALQPFIGKEGKRFMAVLVEIGDDEQPVAASTPAEPKQTQPEPARRELGPICYWLVQRCKEPEFQAWIDAGSPIGAAEKVRAILGVKSRADVDGNEEAEALYHKKIRIPYSAYLARMGAPQKRSRSAEA